MNTFPDPSLDPIHRPGLQWVFRKPWRILAFGLGSGVLRPGPGTWGTLLAWVLWIAGLDRLSDPQMAVFLPVSFLLGCWACHRTGYDLGVPDHGGMNWDEAVAFWLVLWLTPQTWPAQAAAFLLFRFFDILKPPPVRFFDQRLHNGFGVMFDDLLAAAYTLLVLAILVRFGVLA